MTLKRVDNCALKRAGNFDPKGDKNPKTLLQYSQAKRPMRKEKLRNIGESGDCCKSTTKGKRGRKNKQRGKKKAKESSNKEGMRKQK